MVGLRGEGRFLVCLLVVVGLMLAGLAGARLYVRHTIQSAWVTSALDQPTMHDDATRYAWDVLVPTREAQQELSKEWTALQGATGRGDLAMAEAELLKARAIAADAADAINGADVPGFLADQHQALLALYDAVGASLDQAEACLDGLRANETLPSCAQAIHSWRDIQVQASQLAADFYAYYSRGQAPE